MRIVISKEGKGFVADPVDKPGMPRVGRGPTMEAALGDFLVGYADVLGVTIEVAGAARKSEQARHKRAERQR